MSSESAVGSSEEAVQDRGGLTDLHRDRETAVTHSAAARDDYAFRSAVIERADEGICVCHETDEYPYVSFTIWNRRMEEITGYTMQEINRLGWYQTMYRDPQVQAKAQDRMKRMRLGDDLVFENWRITRADGEQRDLSICTSVLECVNGIPNVLALMYDVTERRRGEWALRSRDRILEAVSFSAEKFLIRVPDEASIGAMLARLGESTDASRAYIFQNHSNEDATLLTSQRYEWTRPGVEAQIDNPDLQNFPLEASGFGRWVDVLQRGDLISGLVREFPEAERDVLAAQDIVSILVAPIFQGTDWWGFMGFDECAIERHWSTAETEALRIGADILGAAIQRRAVERELQEARSDLEARVQDRTAELAAANEKLEAEVYKRKRAQAKLRVLAITDELTGLYNRRGFFALAGQQLRVARRLGSETLLLVADLDGLKTINDTFGHHEGDSALIATARILQDSFRESDVIARIGGDEFVVFQIEAEDSATEKMVERLQRRFDLYNASKGRPYTLSASTGVVRCDPDCQSLSSLLILADALMYKKKQRD
jgi:diguanylate cyclase (GGDEF)-like protein/PAS domain S-box-containing protein